MDSIVLPLHPHHIFVVPVHPPVSCMEGPTGSRLLTIMYTNCNAPAHPYTLCCGRVRHLSLQMHVHIAALSPSLAAALAQGRTLKLKSFELDCSRKSTGLDCSLKKGADVKVNVYQGTALNAQPFNKVSGLTTEFSLWLVVSAGGKLD